MSLDFRASSQGIFSGPNIKVRCAIGRGGMTEALNKQEGDGTSPIGRWADAPCLLPRRQNRAAGDRIAAGSDPRA